MRCNRDVNLKWMYMVAACCFGLVTILKIGHGDEWSSILTFVALTLLWGSLAYKTYREERDCEDQNNGITKTE